MWDGIDKRKFPRAQFPCKITIKRKDSPNDKISTETENIGKGGLCVITSKDLGIFAPVEIQLDILDNQGIIGCDGTIVWIIQKKEGGSVYDTGIEFTNLKRRDTERIITLIEKIFKQQSFEKG